VERLQKEQQVKQISETFEKAKSVIFADYRGLDVEEITELRRKLTEADSTIKVIKNRLAKRAAKESKVEGLDEHFTGPTAMASSLVDPVLPAKILVEFAKKHQDLEIKVGYMDGGVMDLSTINHLAKLPSRDVLYAKMLGSMNAPVTNLTMALAAIPRQVVQVINAIKETKEQ